MSVAAVDTFASLDIPPGPKGLPLVGCAPQVKRDTLGFFADFAARYDGIASLRVGLDTVYVLHSPDALEHVFVSNWRNYRKSDFYNKVRQLFGKGIETLDRSEERRVGEEWDRKCSSGRWWSHLNTNISH